MNSVREGLVKYKKLTTGVKIIACVLIVAWLLNNLFIDGMDPYISYEDCLYENESEESFSAANAQCIEQPFYAQSRMLSNMTLYLDEPSDSEVVVQMLDGSRKILVQKSINLRDFTAHEWNRIAIDCNGLQKNGQYTIVLKGEDLSGAVLGASNTYPEIFTNCMVDGSGTENTLAVGLQFTERYMLLGYGFKFAVDLLYLIIIASALCYVVLHFEKLFDIFKSSEKKKGLSYAVYFSVYTVLSFNPLDSVRNEATEFGRIMGAGFNAGIDVSKRISNFNHWFICLAAAFSLFYILANYFKNQELTGESKKARNLLDNLIVIANVALGLRCITYFHNEARKQPLFYYSDVLINLMIFLLIAYILLRLGDRISLEKLEALLLSGWSLALPVAVVITHDWTDGRLLVGLQVFLSVLVILGVKFFKIDWERAWISGGLNIGTVFLSLLPFCTSFYIEFVTLLNRHEVFWTHLRRNYFCAVVLGVLLTVALALVLIRKGKRIENWKRFSYPALVLGFSCLNAQIAISSVYNADIMETANSSILISDFLTFGEIPIVQHYGGHMMNAVWEGILYALLNNDYTGAVLSPYSGYVAVVIAMLFYFFVRYVWDEDAAILTVLFFPFYSSISYWGLGILTALTILAYVKKNTYLRAALFWFSFVWCALYRLDLGSAFGLACMAALFIYIITDRNRLAFKQLAITLAGWAAAGGALWFGICIAKGVHPLNRLLEFLMIGLSNQNWAYEEIGDMTKAAFSWAYLFVPFLVTVCMLYSVFSKRIRENLGTGIWTVNLVLGFSYYFNFSRGLVRHSLAENRLTFVWTAYLFLAVFAVAVTRQKRALLPAYAALVLLDSLFLSGENYFQRSFADTGTEKIGYFTETWTSGRTREGEEPELYWVGLREDRQVINRIEWNENLEKTVEDHAVMIDALLEDDETYVDCMNRTTLYSLLGRRDPVYVSQSPLQLSGEFTQEEFIKQIGDVPIVLMPYGPGGIESGLESSLDGVLNSYRYYRVFEYIYNNYVPLCTYENIYAVWCLPERYDEMASKVRDLMGVGREMEGSALSSESLVLCSGELVENSDGSVKLIADEDVCEVDELQKLFDLAPYTDTGLAVAVAYEAGASTEMQLFYTTEQGEDYDEDKVSVYPLSQKSGTAYFEVPVTQETRLKLCIPGAARVKINSISVSSCNCRLLRYGYDGVDRSEDAVLYDDCFSGVHHSYNLGKLPVIWGEGDRKSSADNNVLATLEYEDGVYRYALSPADYGTAGNYLKVSMDYAGLDQPGKTHTDDETTTAKIRIGKMADGQFETKYTYSFIAEEGQHDYLFRISSDYYWYLGETDAVILESENPLYNIKMAVLEGD